MDDVMVGLVLAMGILVLLIIRTAIDILEDSDE